MGTYQELATYCLCGANLLADERCSCDTCPACGEPTKDGRFCECVESPPAPVWWTDAGLPAQDFARVTRDLNDARHEGMRRLKLLG